MNRVQRFRAGDPVRVALTSQPEDERTLYVAEVHLDPMYPPGYSHCAGKSARYTLSDGSTRYDWELAP